MRVYFMEMFPLPLRLLYAAAIYLSFLLFLQRIHGVQVVVISHYTLIGVWSVFALLLILRLMDELKDADIDLELFRERPLPSGRVMKSDIWFTLVIMIILYLAANLFVIEVFWMAVAVLSYAFLMFRYFFIRRILRRYLLLTLATHNPIIPIMLLYLTVLFRSQYQLELEKIEWSSVGLVIAMYWLPSFAWEISRKIRSKEEENVYVTYSQILGRGGAVFVAGGAQTIAFAIAVYLHGVLSFSRIYLLLMIIGYLATMVGHIRFIVQPSPVTSQLKPFAERFVLTIILTNIIELGILS